MNLPVQVLFSLEEPMPEEAGEDEPTDELTEKQAMFAG